MLLSQSSDDTIWALFEGDLHHIDTIQSSRWCVGADYQPAGSECHAVEPGPLHQELVHVPGTPERRQRMDHDLIRPQVLPGCVPVPAFAVRDALAGVACVDGVQR